MSTPSTDAADAADALAAMKESQRRLAAAATCPPERHLAFAALYGGLVATPALPVHYWIVAEAVLLLAVPLIIRWDRRRTGMFINGYRSGKTRPLTFAMLGIMLLMYLASIWLSQVRGVDWAPLPLAALALLIAYRFSVLWMGRFRQEMGVAP